MPLIRYVTCWKCKIPVKEMNILFMSSPMQVCGRQNTALECILGAYYADFGDK